MRLEKLRLRLSQNSDGADAASKQEENKKHALAYIDGKLEMLESRKADCVKQEAVTEEAQQAAATLPSMQVLEKILRYETKLQRLLSRAMNQLERLQRMRRSEAVPPPIAVEMTERP